MADCRYLDTKDVTPFGADVFDHTDYEYVCEKCGKEVIPFLHCNPDRCKSYDMIICSEGVKS